MGETESVNAFAYGTDRDELVPGEVFCVMGTVLGGIRLRRISRGKE